VESLAARSRAPAESVGGLSRAEYHPALRAPLAEKRVLEQLQPQELVLEDPRLGPAHLEFLVVRENGDVGSAG